MVTAISPSAHDKASCAEDESEHALRGGPAAAPREVVVTPYAHAADGQLEGADSPPVNGRIVGARRPDDERNENGDEERYAEAERRSRATLWRGAPEIR
jgi:hypothetical protein